MTKILKRTFEQCLKDFEMLFNKKNHLDEMINTLMGNTSTIYDKSIRQEGKQFIPNESPMNALYQPRYYDEHDQVFMNDQSAGFILELLPLTTMNDAINHSLHKLFCEEYFAGIHVQVLLVASPKIDFILDRIVASRDDSQVLSKMIAKERVKYLKNSAFNSLSDNTPLLSRHFRCILMITQKQEEKWTMHREKNRSELNSLLTLRHKLVHALKANQITVELIGLNACLSLFRELAAPNQSTSFEPNDYNPLEPINEQIVDSDTRLFIDDASLHFDTQGDQVEWTALTAYQYASTLFHHDANSFSGELIGNLHQMPCPFIVVLNFTIESCRQEESFLTKMNNPNKEQTAHSELAKIEKNIQKKYYDTCFLQHYLSEGGKTVKSHFQVVLLSQIGQSTANEAVAKRLFGSHGVTLKKYADLQFLNYLALQPFMFSEGLLDDFKKMRWLKTITLQNAIDLLPIQAEWYGTYTPAMLFSGRRGQLMTFDNFDKAGKVGNFNIAVSAQSGAGKSVLMQDMIAAKLAQGAKIFIIDNGRSYERLVDLYGGEVIQFDRANPVSLNFFSELDENAKSFSDELQAIIHLIKVMAKPQGQLNEVESGILERIVHTVWEKEKQSASIKKVYEALLNDPGLESTALAEMLYSYAFGAHQCYFSGPCQINFNKQITVIDLEDLLHAGDLMQVILCAYIHKIKSTIYQSDRGTQKLVVIDEAWKLLDSHSPMTARFIEEGYRCSRKYTCSFITITQHIDDFFKNATTRTAFDCSQFKIFMSQNINQSSEISHSFSKAEKILIESLSSCRDYSEFLIKEENTLQIARLILDPFSKALFTTTGSDFSKIQRYQQQGMSLIEAVQTLAKTIESGS